MATERHMLELLRARYSAPEWAFLTGVANGTGGRASRWADGIAMNLWPFCAASPRDLKAWLRTDPRTPAHLTNLNVRRRVAREAPFILAAWGAQAGVEGAAALDYMLTHGLDVRHLGLTRGGAPRHPLYVAAVTEPECFLG